MFLVLLKKELYNEFRSRELILSMLVFGLSIILAYAFTSDVSRVIVANYAPGMFWAMILFVTVLGIHRSFSYEKEMDAFSMLIAAPIDRGLIYLSKFPCISTNQTRNKCCHRLSNRPCLHLSYFTFSFVTFSTFII